MELGVRGVWGVVPKASDAWNRAKPIRECSFNWFSSLGLIFVSVIAKSVCSEQRSCDPSRFCYFWPNRWMTLMAEDIDRSGLFNEIRQFSQRKLKKVETKETTGSGEVLTVKRNAKGLQTIKSEGVKSPGYVVDHKPDLQVGMVIPGLFIGKSHSLPLFVTVAYFLCQTRSRSCSFLTVTTVIHFVLLSLCLHFA